MQTAALTKGYNLKQWKNPIVLSEEFPIKRYFVIQIFDEDNKFHALQKKMYIYICHNCF